MLTEKITLPTGRVITIREMNGEDEVSLSQTTQLRTREHLNVFLSRITQEADPQDVDESGQPLKRYTPNQVAQWPLADKYYAALAARIISLGPDLNFNVTFQGRDENRKGYDFTENLTKFYTTLDKYHELTPEELSALDPDAAKPYPKGRQMVHEHTLSSGKQIRWELLSSYGEKLLLQRPADELSKSDEILARKLEILREGKWFLLENLRQFTSRDLVEIRGFFEKYDLKFTMPLSVTSPKTGITESIPAITLEEFFFPTTITS
jgi:hypothetical protein